MKIFRLSAFQQGLSKDAKLSMLEICRANEVSGSTVEKWIKLGLFPKPEWHMRLARSRKPTRYWRVDVLLPLIGKEFPFGKEEWKNYG